MAINYTKLVNDSIGQLLTKKYGFRQLSEFNDGQSYTTTYGGEHFSVKLEKYRREFYDTIYKADNSDREIALTNLLNYLHQKNPHFAEPKYFPDEPNLEECYRKQLEHIAHTIENHFKEIEDFFTCADFESKTAELREFMLNTYPHLFKRVSDPK